MTEANKLQKFVKSGSLSNQIAKMSHVKPKYRGMPSFYFSKELHICPPLLLLFSCLNSNRGHVLHVKVKSITRPVKNIDLQGVKYHQHESISGNSIYPVPFEISFEGVVGPVQVTQESFRL